MQATGRIAAAIGAGIAGVTVMTLVVPLLALGAGGFDDSGEGCSPPSEPSSAEDASPTILGPTTMSAADLAAWWGANHRGQPANLSVAIEKVIIAYVDEGHAEGVRGDLALAQAVLETGWFTSNDTAINNFAGIAHPDGASSGAAFPDPRTGVRAHIQLLKKLAAGNNVDLTHPDVAPNAAATATTWADLAGTWASDPTYWTKLNEIYTDMLTHTGTGETAAAGAGPACPPGSPDIPLGTDVEASLTNVRGITVHTSIARQLDAMIGAAAADGVSLSGSGYRSHDRQIELRRRHCGTSDYAIYQMPSGQCSPPTARPGASMHEQGLAVDFVNCSSHSTACWQWLDAHAATFGFFNLPSEPWHWSIDGR